jgi:hypothetical protein
MHDELPKEVLTAATKRTIDRFDDGDEESTYEVEPPNESEYLGDLIVRMPKWHLIQHAVFHLKMMELGEFPKRVTFRAAAPFPTKENTSPDTNYRRHAIMCRELR